MPSTRRALLRATAIGLSGVLAGCTGDRPAETTERTAGTTRTTRTGRTTTTGTEDTSSTDETARTTDETARTTDDETTTDDATAGGREPPRAVEFAHDAPAFASGLADAGTRYFARRFRRAEDLAAALDRSAVREDALARVERLLAGTDYPESEIFVIQAAFPSPEYGLDVTFRSHRPVPHVTLQTRRRDRDGSGSAVSTLLLRVSSRFPSSPAVTIADIAGARASADTAVTFAPPNDLLYETANVGPVEALPTHSGALVGSQARGERLVPADHSGREFVRATDFEESYLLAIGSQIQNGGGFVWPGTIDRTGDRIAARIWRHGLTGGPSAEFGRLALVRVPGETPARGTATVRILGRRRVDRVFELSTDSTE